MGRKVRVGVRSGRTTVLVLLATALLASVTNSGTAIAQQAPPPRPGLTQERIDELSHKHDGYYGALAPQNLSKHRPKPGFNLTGTWFVDLRRSFNDFMYGPPYPQFYEPGQTALKEAAEARKAGKPYRDSIGQCYPAGMPMIMTRVWPISMVQMPTVIYMMFGFTNSLRIIYLDGRPHTDPDIAISTYNGESIGHWEGSTLVVDTIGIKESVALGMGMKHSDKLHLTERIHLDKVDLDTLIDELTAEDPEALAKPWVHTFSFKRSREWTLLEFICAENDRNPVDANGETGFKKE